jgi:hypothetical protein
MQGKIKQTPKQQSKLHVVVCKMRRQPYHTIRGSAAQIRQGRVQQVHQRRRASTPKTVCALPNSHKLPKASTLSTPKIACALPKASTVSMPCGMYVLEGKYNTHTKDVVYVAKGEYGRYTKGDRICRGGLQPASHQRRQQQTPCQGWQLAEYDDEPLTTRQLAPYIMQDDNEHLTIRMSDPVHRARQQ